MYGKNPIENFLSCEREIMGAVAKLIPLISIGMPVYNGEKYIRKALDSLLAQTFTDFELIISDNASTDETEVICREYETKDRRIRYVRWAQNRGAIANFNFVLDEAIGNYFIWAACDDIRSIDYLELNFNFLEQNPDYIASTCQTRYEDGSFDRKLMGDGALEGCVPERISEFLECWHANGRFYSLFRTQILKKYQFIHRDFLGSDWAIVMNVISEGKTMRFSQGYLVLGRSGFSNSGNILKYYRKNFVHYVIPFYELVKCVILISSCYSYMTKINIYKKLLSLNMQAIKFSIICKIKYYL